MTKGYSQEFIDAVATADATLLGVKLGKRCIAKRISVTEVAQEMGVTRQTVYSWFTGRFQPKEDVIPALKELYARYASR